MTVNVHCVETLQHTKTPEKTDTITNNDSEMMRINTYEQ